MHYKHNAHVMKIAIKYGCKTMKEFSTFLKKYASKIEVTTNGREIFQPSLF